MTGATARVCVGSLMARLGFDDLSDRELLRRFSDGDQAAFAALVRRHGPMVLSTCRRVLADAADADDVFQAAFLTLARRAGRRTWADSVAGWLHTVAYRLALKLRAQTSRRAAREARADELPPPRDPLAEVSARELYAAVDEELNRLPEKYRLPVLLCCYEGLSRDEAAKQLGWSFGALKGRLERGRDLLRRRLEGRGLALSIGLAAWVLLPADLGARTVRLAAGAEASARVAALVLGVTRSMILAKLKVVAAACLLVGTVALGIAAARPGAAADLSPVPEADRPTDAAYADVTAVSGVRHTFRNGEEAGHRTLLEAVGGGAALLDYDGDGLIDLFVAGGGGFTGPDKKEIVGRPCRLYRNRGGFRFEDVTERVGVKIDRYTHGAAVADYDADGWPDLLVTGWGGVSLLHNEPAPGGGRRFVDVTARAGLFDRTWSVSAAWGDLDGDGRPDLYICRYLDWSFANHPNCTYDGKTPDICPPKQFHGLPHVVYRNNGDGTFTDVSRTAGLRPEGKGLGVLFADVNGDGRPDIYVANDTTDNYLYINRSQPGAIRLEEVGLAAGVARDERGGPNGSMGLDAGDPLGTGRPALWVTNYENELNALYLNECVGGRVQFRFGTQRTGIAAIGQQFVGWGTGFVDYDLDGWEDIVATNGHVVLHPRAGGAPRAQRPILLRNEPRKGSRAFRDVVAEAGPYFATSHVGRGLALGDLDNDGRVDLVFVPLNEPVALARNVAGSGRHWLGLELRRPGRADVVGTRVAVVVGGRTQTRFAKGGGSYLSANDARLVFGLDTTEKIDRVSVTWPDGKEETWRDLPSGRYWRLTEGEKEAR